MDAYDQKRAILEESMRLLATHEPFMRFMEAMETLREGAIADACRNDVVDNQGRVMAALGEVRAYNDIKSLYTEYLSKPVEY